MALSRRLLLQNVFLGCAGALSGCTRMGVNQASPTPKPTPTVSTSPPLSIDDFFFDASVQQQFSVEKPAQIRVTFQNVAQSVLQVQGRPYVPCPDVISRPGRETFLILVPEDLPQRVELVDSQTGISRHLNELLRDGQINGCWTIDMGRWDQIATLAIKATASVKPRELISQTYTVLDGNQGDPCLPAGPYDASGEIEIAKNPRASSATSNTFALSLTVWVEDNRQISVDVEKPEPHPSG